MSKQNQADGSQKSVVLVGHCGPDQFMLRSTVERALPGVRVEAVNKARALESHLHEGAILLINRVLDGRFGMRGGIELIEHIRQSGNGQSPAMLLISDLADAQQEAQQAGALPGFGKRELYDEQTIERLRAAAAAL